MENGVEAVTFDGLLDFCVQKSLAVHFYFDQSKATYELVILGPSMQTINMRGTDRGNVLSRAVAVLEVTFPGDRVSRVPDTRDLRLAIHEVLRSLSSGQGVHDAGGRLAFELGKHEGFLATVQVREVIGAESARGVE